MIHWWSEINTKTQCIHYLPITHQHIIIFRIDTGLISFQCCKGIQLTAFKPMSRYISSLTYSWWTSFEGRVVKSEAAGFKKMVELTNYDRNKRVTIPIVSFIQTLMIHLKASQLNKRFYAKNNHRHFGLLWEVPTLTNNISNLQKVYAQWWTFYTLNNILHCWLSFYD